MEMVAEQGVELDEDELRKGLEARLKEVTQLGNS